MRSEIDAIYLILLFCLTSCFSQKGDQKALLDFMKTEEGKGFSGCLLLVEKDKVVFNHGFGWADRDLQIPNGDSTIYPYGSIVKDYTKTAIFLLASKGQLSIESTIDKYFGNLPDEKKKITIGQLIQHRSGLHPYHDQDNKAREKWPGIPGDFIPMSKEACFEYIYEQELLFEPGSKFSYSNSGYTLLALIIEKVTGKKYEDIIREMILNPAGMTTTDFYQSPIWKEEQVAIGYGPKSFGKKNSPFYWPRNPYPLLGNGGMAGTLYDFYLGLKYMERLKENNSEFKILATKYSDMNGDIPQDIVGSSGGNDFGFVSVIFGIKSSDQYMIFCTNNDDDGKEEVNVIATIIKLGFNFDLMSLAPDNESADTSEESDISKSKLNWKLPDKPHWNRVSLLLDLLESRDTTAIEAFIKQNCNDSFIKSVSEQGLTRFFKDLMKLAPIKLVGAEYATPDVKLKIQTEEVTRVLEVMLTNDRKRLIDQIKVSN